MWYVEKRGTSFVMVCKLQITDVWRFEGFRLAFSFSTTCGLVLCFVFLASIIICLPTGESSDDDAGEGAIPEGGLKDDGVTAVRKSELREEFERMGVKGTSGLAERQMLFSFCKASRKPTVAGFLCFLCFSLLRCSASWQSAEFMEVDEGERWSLRGREIMGVNGSVICAEVAEFERSKRLCLYSFSFKLELEPRLRTERGPRGMRMGGLLCSGLFEGVGAVTITLVGTVIITLTLRA